LTAQEYSGKYAEAKTEEQRKELRDAGFTGSHREQILRAVKDGKSVPQEVVDQVPEAIEFKARAKIAGEFGDDYMDRIRAKAANPVHEVIRQNENGTITVRQEQRGGKFIVHEKGQVVTMDGKPMIVSKAGKSYQIRTDGQVYAYAQDIAVREPKKSETENAEQAKHAAAAVRQHDSQARHESYADEKKKNMAEHERLVRAAMGAA
jgi:hypothetical protein